MKLIKTVRRNWKKSLFLLGASVMGSRYGYNRYCEHLLLRQYCQRIQHHSLTKHQSDHAIKQITVFINPSCANGKGSKIFKKFALPMLNMSGINFVVVPTAYEGHVSSLLKYLPEHTEAVIVAGGDGMLQDTVTALLRSKNRGHLPVGYIPIGTNNTFCSRYLENPTEQSNVDLICQSVINIVQGYTAEMPIMEIVPTKGKTIYAMSYFTWGAIKDSVDMIPGYWWTGGMRTMCAMLRYSIRSAFPTNITASIDGEVQELSNITVTASQASLLKYTHPAVQERMQFIEEIGLAVNKRRHSGILDKIRLDDEAVAIQEISIEPQTEGKFFVDGESVDSRTVSIRLVADLLKMFVPESLIPAEEVRLLPGMPKSVESILQKLYTVIGITG